MNNELLITCPECNGFGEVRTWRLSPESDCDLATCPTCHGEGTVDHNSGLDADAALECDTPLGMADDDGDMEPPDLDSDAGYDPYTGGAEDDGFDTYGDDY